MAETYIDIVCVVTRCVRVCVYECVSAGGAGRLLRSEELACERQRGWGRVLMDNQEARPSS